MKYWHILKDGKQWSRHMVYREERIAVWDCDILNQHETDMNTYTVEEVFILNQKELQDLLSKSYDNGRDDASTGWRNKTHIYKPYAALEDIE